MPLGPFLYQRHGLYPTRNPPIVNKLYVGFSKTIELPKGGCLFISDDVPSVPRARIFDPKVDCFNPLKNIDYKKAREIADVLYTVAPQGENTLTVRNGKRTLSKALLDAKRFDDIDGDEEVDGMIGDLLLSPILRRVLCNPGSQFSFKPTSVILAKLDRAELGDGPRATPRGVLQRPSRRS